MNKKIVTQFILLTFLIAVAAWGICAAFGVIGYTVENTPWLYVFVAFCAWSPTIASYIALKNNNAVSGFKEWLRNIFSVKSPFRFYLFVIALIAVFLIPQMILTGLREVQPLHMIFAMLPATFLFGGLEEIGWRYALQPQLEKKFGFILSSIITAVIWAAWHIPVFLPQGRIESISWLGLFAVQCLGLSFALGAISKITKSVFLCIVFHWITNIGSGMISINENYTLWGSILPASLLFIVSFSAVIMYENKCKRIKQ